MSSVGVGKIDTGETVEDTVALLRARLAAASTGRAKSVVPQNQQTVTVAASEQRTKELLPIPEVLAGLLPGGGLARGSVISVDGARSMLVSMIASITAAGGYVAVIGQPHLSLHAAAEMGADLSRIATVDGAPGFDRGRSTPGFDAVEVAAVLLDGLDLVVVGLGGVSVPPSRSRAVMARARAKGAALVVTDGRWSGAQASLTAQVADYQHLPFRHLGHGRIAGMSLTVSARGRGARRTDARIDVVRLDDRVQLVAATKASPISDSPAAQTVSLSVAN